MSVKSSQSREAVLGVDKNSTSESDLDTHQKHRDSTASEEEKPTFSHALAEEYDPKVLDEDERITDSVRADAKPVDEDYAAPEEVLGTLSREEFWMLIRRFNKQISHVREMSNPPPGDLDLNSAVDEEFTPEKLRSSLERFYMTVIIGLMGFVQHIVRLRSWKEKRRTSAFCVAYFTAWYLNAIMPLLIGTLITLIIYPPSRTYLFPPVPLALIDKTSGDIQKPPAGMLGSKDSITGAPEAHKGEAVEQEAFNFVSGMGSIVISTATGEHPVEETDEVGDVADNSGLEKTSAAAQAITAKAAVTGIKGDKHDKTKTPMQAMTWSKARPLMKAISTACDIWERFANALSPTPPFGKKPRYVIASVVIPGLPVTLFLSSALIVKSIGLLAGLIFFGQPGIDRGIRYLNVRYPHWTDLLDIRNSILRHVPTNAQLTLTLLRIGEAKNAPLPPPPVSSEPSSKAITPPNAEDLPLETSQYEINRAALPTPEEKHPPEYSKPSHRSRLLRFFKGTAKTGVETGIGTDHVRAAAGSKNAKRRLGILPRTIQKPKVPCEFKARYEGRRGYVVFTTTATVPCIAFSAHSEKDSIEAEGAAELKPIFSIPLAEIKELKKVGGLGWKAKMIVGWAMERQIADALEVVDLSGRKWRLTAMPGRDELFNRLIAAGEQRWECV